MSYQHDWMAGMTDFQRGEVARLESRIVSFEKRWESLEADWNDCKKALAAAIKQRDEARMMWCRIISLTRRGAGEDFAPADIAVEYGWDCFAQQDGGGA